ncbi:MAG TPA: indole-3-glycerol phosphate synthase TrpC [Bacteroidota bacterium]|jgi:indole-3-glycerol phosphate synthase|nr:indole-3-glycerol phosphate synthase TrpC [Bacteroidota bacterium]
MNFLKTIVEHKYEEVKRKKTAVRRSDLESMESFERGPSSLSKSLTREPFGIIAEIKRSSPSAGVLRRDLKPADVAKAYEANGAAAVSVLTDERFFSGSIDDLKTVRASVGLPVLRKEFIVDEYQVFEAKAFGADAILLIAAILDPAQMHELFMAATELKLECLVELYDVSEIDKLDFDTMRLVGINNRDLKTFIIDIQRTLTMASHLPPGITVVSESGITSPDDLNRLKDHDIRAALIGEYLMKSDRPGETLRKLLDGVAP